MASVLKEVTATGDVATVGLYVKSVCLTAGSDAASAVLREGGGSGTIRLSIKAATNTTVQWTAADHDGAYLPGAVHATLTGTGPTLTVEYA